MAARGYVGAVDVASFVADDERALAAAAPTARVGVVRTPAVSFGVGHRLAVETQSRAERRGWSLVARRTGGTSLYHAPGDLVWSIVLPRGDRRVGRDYARAYGRLGGGLVRWLSSHGIAAAWEPTASTFPPYCLLNGLGETLQANGRALAGAAQHATRAALLHHGVACTALDDAAIAEVFEMPRSLPGAGLTGLHALGIDAPPERLAGELADCLEQFVGETFG